MSEPDWDRLIREHYRMLGDLSQAFDQEEEHSRQEDLEEYYDKKGDDDRDEPKN